MCHLILPRIDKPHLDHTRVQDIISCHESAIRHRGATPEAPLGHARRPLKDRRGLGLDDVSRPPSAAPIPVVVRRHLRGPPGRRCAARERRRRWCRRSGPPPLTSSAAHNGSPVQRSRHRARSGTAARSRCPRIGPRSGIARAGPPRDTAQCPHGRCSSRTAAPRRRPSRTARSNSGLTAGNHLVLPDTYQHHSSDRVEAMILAHPRCRTPRERWERPKTNRPVLLRAGCSG